MDNQNNQPTNQQSPDPVVVTPTKAPETQINRTKQKWSLKKLLLVIAGSIIIFILALVTIVNISTSAPVKVSDELVAAIQSNDSTAAYKYFQTMQKPQSVRTTLRLSLLRFHQY